MQTDAGRIRIIVLLSGDWARFHRPASLSYFINHDNYEVVLVDKPADPLVGSFKHHDRWSEVFRKRVERFNHTTVRLRPWVPFHEYLLAPFVPLFAKMNRLFLKRQLKAVLQDDGKKTVLWVYNPIHFHLLGLFNEDFVLYESYDAHVLQLGISGIRRRQLSRDEIALSRAADLIVATSRKLVNGYKQNGLDAILLPNAVDYDFFSRVVGMRKQREGRRPAVGLLGSLNDLVDVGLLQALIKLSPDMDFIIIGPMLFKDRGKEKQFRVLTESANVTYHGPLYNEDLVRACVVFDVAIVAYSLESEYITYICPNKMNEYFAMELPVVATRVPELEPYAEQVDFADTADDFRAALLRALESDSDVLRAHRREIAVKNSWEARSIEIDRVLRARINDRVGELEG